MPTLARRSSPASRLCPAPVRAGGYGPPPDGLAPCPPTSRHAPLRREDLGLELPPIEVDLGSLDHPLVAEARRLAPAAPRGQKRILSIEHPLVYRIRHARWGGATWFEVDEARFWLCAGAPHEEGSDDDACELFAALHEAGRLLPDADDQLRDALERNARIIDNATAAIPEALANALAHSGRDVAIRLGDLIDARLHATAAGEEIWVAIATQAVDGRFVEGRLRDVLFRLIFDAAATELEDREPTGPWASWPGSRSLASACASRPDPA